MSLLNKIILTFTPVRVKHVCNQDLREYYRQEFEFVNRSYSQEGEDRILQRLFENRDKGFYVDVGAHHPKRFSNTYLLYRRGWRGINIDPLPGMQKQFDALRPEDINLEFGVSSSAERLTYYGFNEPALNTFIKERADEICFEGKYELIDKKQVKTERLETILDNFLPQDQPLDILTVDAEGCDMDVLNSNNWHKFRAGIILVENLGGETPGGYENISSHMQNIGYSFVAKTVNTLFFRDMRKPS